MPSHAAWLPHRPALSGQGMRVGLTAPPGRQAGVISRKPAESIDGPPERG
jgi:hypothetical protein